MVESITFLKMRPTDPIHSRLAPLEMSGLIVRFS